MTQKRWQKHEDKHEEVGRTFDSARFMMKLKALLAASQKFFCNFLSGLSSPLRNLFFWLILLLLRPFPHLLSSISTELSPPLSPESSWSLHDKKHLQRSLRIKPKSRGNSHKPFAFTLLWNSSFYRQDAEYIKTAKTSENDIIHERKTETNELPALLFWVELLATKLMTIVNRCLLPCASLLLCLSFCHSSTVV